MKAHYLSGYWRTPVQSNNLSFLVACKNCQDSVWITRYALDTQDLTNPSGKVVNWFLDKSTMLTFSLRADSNTSLGTSDNCCMVTVRQRVLWSLYLKRGGRKMNMYSMDIVMSFTYLEILNHPRQNLNLYEDCSNHLLPFLRSPIVMMTNWRFSSLLLDPLDGLAVFLEYALYHTVRYHA